MGRGTVQQRCHSEVLMARGIDGAMWRRERGGGELVSPSGGASLPVGWLTRLREGQNWTSRLYRDTYFHLRATLRRCRELLGDQTPSHPLRRARSHLLEQVGMLQRRWGSTRSTLFSTNALQRNGLTLNASERAPSTLRRAPSLSGSSLFTSSTLSTATAHHLTATAQLLDFHSTSKSWTRARSPFPTASPVAKLAQALPSATHHELTNKTISATSAFIPRRANLSCTRRRASSRAKALSDSRCSTRH